MRTRYQTSSRHPGPAYLLDTHVLLWWLADAPNLSEDIKKLIDSEQQMHVSSAAAWEIGIKVALGKLDAPDNYFDQICEQFYELPIEFEHAQVAGALPLIHGDPFDRIMIAQAQFEGLTIITRDEKICKYDVPVLDGV